MPAPYYRSLVAVAASLSLLTAGCTVTRTAQDDAAVGTQLPQQVQQASTDPDGMDTESTIWTLLGIAKKPTAEVGPKTGPEVSGILWQATLDTLNFVPLGSSDPMAGLAVTNWYTPKTKSNERMRVTAFIKAKALRSDSVVVTVDRQVRGPDGQWQDAPIDRSVADDLETSILQRARQIHIARIRALQ